MPEARLRRLLRGALLLPSLTAGLAAAPCAVAVAAEVTPVITSVSANHGPPVGGNEVVIRATGIADVTAFAFGSSHAAIIARNPGAVVVTAPAGFAGANVDVRMWTDSGAVPVQTGSGDDYTYDGPRRYPLTLTPNRGASAGGTTVTITAADGADLSGAQTVKFGYARAKIVSRSANALTVVAPGGRPGEPWIVSVTGADGHTDDSAPSVFSWDAVTGPPEVTAVEPGEVHRFPGRIFTIKGRNLEGADDLLIDGESVGRAITPIESEPGGPLWLTYPDEGKDIGKHEVLLTGPTGTSQPWSGSSFTVLPDGPAAVIDSITPSTFSQTAPTELVIRGQHLAEVQDLTWSFPARRRVSGSMKVISDQEIRITSPVFVRGGMTRLRVTTTDGGLSGWSTAQAEVGAPAPISISSTQGSIHGGDRVVITADREVLQAMEGVWFGDKRLPIESSTWTSVTVVAPPHAAGSELVTLAPSTAPGDRLNASSDRYTWVDAPAEIKQRLAVTGTATLTTIARGPLALRGTLDASFDRQRGFVNGTLRLEPVTARLVSLGPFPVTGKVAFVPATAVSGSVQPTGHAQLAVKLRVKVLEAKLFGAIPLAVGNACQTRSLSDVGLPLGGPFDPLVGGVSPLLTFKISDLNGCDQIASAFSASTAGTGTIRLELKAKP